MLRPLPFLLPLFLLLLHPHPTQSQDQCNLLPIRTATFPLYTLHPHTLLPTNTTLCTAYTPPNTTQETFIRTLVNLAFTGHFTPLPNLWPASPNGTYQSTGILDPAALYRDPCFTITPINLVPYFNGTYLSNNRNSYPVAKNHLDSGSTPSLLSSPPIPAWSPSSTQSALLTNFYTYFGLLLGCTDPSFPPYTGRTSMAEVHRFMDLRAPEMHYFIHCFYDAALSVGVAGPDLVTHVGDAISIGVALDNVFNKRCSPPQSVGVGQHEELQAMCGDVGTCATWSFPNATCAAYNASGYGVPPTLAPSASGASASASASFCNPHYPQGTQGRRAWRP